MTGVVTGQPVTDRSCQRSCYDRSGQPVTGPVTGHVMTDPVTGYRSVPQMSRSP
ncbi:hypothetical protein DPMN_159954 [Dreissena polymorpha]|uniref:Uncharacterized protein n=1 Tax=Dreissena polymorpha TaxID=45954 RepID=A0A9D4IS50_DREPO|nr:hypothetical protein DPMN_159954 [Dreissena polymorpha]